MPSVISGDANVSSAEFGYLDGVTSALQTQINGKATYTDWTSYTPTLTQVSAIATKTNASRYCIVGNVVHVVVYIFGNGTGTAGNEMTLSLPVNCAATGLRLGPAAIYDASAAVAYSGMSIARSASTFAVIGDWSASYFWGVTPSLAIGTDDQFMAVLTYERG